MKRYKRFEEDTILIEQEVLNKIKETSVNFSTPDGARDAIADIIYFLSKSIGYDKPQFCINISYALYSGICSHLQDQGIYDEGIMQKKAKDAIQKILNNVKRFTI
jgi:hypothetical protein